MTSSRTGSRQSPAGKATACGKVKPVSEIGIRSYQESVVIEVEAGTLYDLVSDVTRTGEWSPVCTSCWWDDDTEAGHAGAWFTGRNELPERTWETRSQVVVARPGREFAWLVGGRFVLWAFSLIPAETSTTLTESWDFLPEGIAMFNEKYGDHAQMHIAERTQQALNGIPRTLAAIKRIAEAQI
jgi:hypothetical protein